MNELWFGSYIQHFSVKLMNAVCYLFQETDSNTDEQSDLEDVDYRALGQALSDSSSRSDSDSECEDNFNFTPGHLDQEVQFEDSWKARELLLLDVAMSSRHKLTYECLLDLFANKNLLLGKKIFPTSTKQLWKLLSRSSAGICKHYYCNDCGSYIASEKVIGPIATCPGVELGKCKFSKPVKKTKHFITLSLKKQLKNFLALPGVGKLLKYREERKVLQASAIEDIFDGKVYKHLQAQGKATNDSFDFSYIVNTDGCRMRKGAKAQVFPLYLRLNEPPPNLRQKFMFLGGLFMDTVEPKMSTFLKPICEELAKLETHGVKWTPRPGAGEVKSRFFCCGFCCDGKARYQILNMSTHSTHYACTMCTIKGVTVDKTVRWPLEHEEMPLVEERTDAGMKQDMTQATLQEASVRGHQGSTPLMLLPSLNLRDGNGVDDLHAIYEGAVAHITNLLLHNVERCDRSMGYDVLCSIIDRRLKAITTPSNIARKPGNTSIKNIAQMKGSELRNWILYYALICLLGLIPNVYLKPLEHLSRAAYLFSMDSITERDATEADYNADLFLRLNEDHFGVECTKMTLHTLKHILSSIKNLGPSWCYTTFNFESWNHKIMHYVSSPNGVLSQIATRFLLESSLQWAIHIEGFVSREVRDRLVDILSPKRLKIAEKKEHGVYMLGKSAAARIPSEDEAAILLQEEIYDIHSVIEYERAKIRSFRITKSGLQEDSKTNDSLIYSHHDTFCTILKIVVLQKHDGSEVVGCFVKEHDVVQPPPFQYATHISCLKPPEFDILHFIKMEQIRSPVVRMPGQDGDMFVCPLPNTFEID